MQVCKIRFVGCLSLESVCTDYRSEVIVLQLSSDASIWGQPSALLHPADNHSGAANPALRDGQPPRRASDHAFAQTVTCGSLLHQVKSKA